MARSSAPPEPAAPTVLGMGCVYVPVTDVHTSGQWYAGAFGLDVSPNTPQRPDMTHAILTYPPAGAGRPGLFLFGCEALSEKPRRKDGLEMLTLCLLVDDVPLLIAETALHHAMSVVTVDRNFERIAEVRPLVVRRLSTQ